MRTDTTGMNLIANGFSVSIRFDLSNSTIIENIISGNILESILPSY